MVEELDIKPKVLGRIYTRVKKVMGVGTSEKNRYVSGYSLHVDFVTVSYATSYIGRCAALF